MSRLLRTCGKTLACVLLVGACLSGGANSNQKTVGDQPGGVNVVSGDIAVAPTGEYIVFRSFGELAIGWLPKAAATPPSASAKHDAATAARPTFTRTARLPVASPRQLAFAKTRPVVYVTSMSDHKLHAVDVEEAKTLWSTRLEDEKFVTERIASSSDDRRIAIAREKFLTILDAGTGRVVTRRDLGRTIVDLDMLPGDDRAIVTLSHEWKGDAVDTPIHVVHLEDGRSRVIHVPNCSDDVAVMPDGFRAMLAPTRCGKDPVSLLDLSPDTERFVRNLPGFGPVALSPDGTVAAAFFDTDAADVALFDDKAKMPPKTTRYHLMIIDTGTLAYRFAPVGSNLPRYAMTPDGNVLLVDSEWEDGTRMFDTREMAFKKLRGPAIELDDFVLTNDSKHAYVLEHGGLLKGPNLFDIDIASGDVREIPTGGRFTNLNISPDDQTLYLRETDGAVCVFPLAEKRCRVRLELP